MGSNLRPHPYSLWNLYSDQLHFPGEKLSEKLTAICSMSHARKGWSGYLAGSHTAWCQWYALKESESEVAQSCPTLCDPVGCSLPGSSLHGILQARILEWVAISYSRGSSRPRDRIQVSRIAGRRFNLQDALTLLKRIRKLLPPGTVRQVKQLTPIKLLLR